MAPPLHPGGLPGIWSPAGFGAPLVPPPTRGTPMGRASGRPRAPQGAEPGPPRSVIQLLAGSFNFIASNSSSCCLVVVSARWNPYGLRCFLSEFVAALCARHTGASGRTRCRTRAGGRERSTGMCGQLGNGSINNSSSKLQPAKAHPSRCSSLPGF